MLNIAGNFNIWAGNINPKLHLISFNLVLNTECYTTGYFVLFFSTMPPRRCAATVKYKYIAGAVHKPTKNDRYSGHQADTKERNWEVGNWRLWFVTPVNDWYRLNWFTLSFVLGLNRITSTALTAVVVVTMMMMSTTTMMMMMMMMIIIIIIIIIIITALLQSILSDMRVEDKNNCWNYV